MRLFQERLEVVEKPSAETVAVEEELFEEPEGSAIKNIFSEIQLLAETGPNSQLLKVKKNTTTTDRQLKTLQQ